MGVIDLFQLDIDTAKKIKNEVLGSVEKWKLAATKIGISRAEQQLMASAFNV